MKANRRTGIIIGILFIVGTFSGILSFFFTGTVSDSPEYLAQIAESDKQFIFGSLLILLMGFSLAFIPIVLYPVLKNHNKALAIGYVVFRGAIETVTYLAVWVSMLLLLFVGESYAISGDDAQWLTSAADVIFRFRELGSMCIIFTFGIGAILFYLALYQSELLPRWLSVWGLIAIILHLVTGFLILFGVQTETSTSISIMNFPIFLQEMVMAIWLIAKGLKAEPFYRS
ncbi:hypothetical protein C900_01932 [Fulvivirga imtechensis AK7]|uniref:DUF4386 domain-containing protein n=1 Tax=Fulvivirga imtechensis AK7 TaxID=1237149 RepID=L8JXX8_9BACT|nr:DUF4386 domain-containing protein [Fulvivirga imtechensis]ELR72067.1 hypothetical protein C900_01932 [Fulvivirga imtechensis AK7]